MKAEVDAANHKAAEGLLANPDSYTNLKTGYGQASPSAVIARNVVDVVEADPTPERWDSALAVMGKIHDEGAPGAIAGVRGLLGLRKSASSLSEVEPSKEQMKKYAKLLVDAGFMSR